MRRVSSDMLRAVFGLFLFAATAAAQSFDISPSLPGPPPGQRSTPRLAAASNGYLVAWFDFRGDRRTLRARQLDIAGLPEGGEVVIEDAVSYDVASDGSEYLLAHGVCAAHPQCITGPRTTHFVRITRHGAFRSRQTIAGLPTAVAAVGNDFAVAISDFTPKIAVVAIAGAVLREPFAIEGARAPILATETLDGRVAFAWIAPNPLEVRFAIASHEDLLAGRVVSKPVAPATGSFPRVLGVSATRRGYVVTWTDDRDIFTVAIDAAGNVAGSDHQRKTTYPVVSGSTGSTHVVLDDNAFLPISDAGEIGEFHNLTDGGRTFGSLDSVVAPDGSGAIVAYTEESDSFYTFDLRLARIDSAGRTATPFGAPNLLIGLPDQNSPRVARCGDGYAVVWEELSRKWLVHYRRFTREGVAIDPPRRRVPAPMAGEQRWPVVACVGDAMLVAWTEDDIRGSIVNSRQRGALFPSGARDPIALDLGNAGIFERHSIASDGRESFAVMSRNFNRLEVRRLNTAGVRVGTPFEIRARTLASSIAWNGSEYLLSWSTEGAVHARRLSRTLEPIGDVVELGITTTHPVWEIAIAPSPRGWLVAWVGTNGSAASFIRAASMQLNRDLVPLDSVGGVPLEMKDGPRSVAWNGCAYEIHLEDRTIVRPPFGPSFEIVSQEPRLALAAGADRFVVSSRIDDTRRLVGAIEAIRCAR